MEGFYNTWGRPRFFYLSLFICLLVILASGITIVAGESNQKPSKATSTKLKSSGPYCGMYWLCAVMKLSAQEVDFLKLVKREYISSRKGSPWPS